VRKPPAESNPVSIGPAEPAEAAAIAALIQRAFAPYRGRLQPEPSALRETADSIRSILETDSILVARRGRTVIGCVAVQRRAEMAYVQRLAVDPSARRGGLGRALMDEAERLARGQGFRRLCVETRLALGENRAFFRTLGFVECAQRSHPGFAHPTYVELEKTLI
jgi:N-acetylglutamate synthase-like GNAT family acetyltransferase